MAATVATGTARNAPGDPGQRPAQRDRDEHDDRMQPQPRPDDHRVEHVALDLLDGTDRGEHDQRGVRLLGHQRDQHGRPAGDDRADDPEDAATPVSTISGSASGSPTTSNGADQDRVDGRHEDDAARVGGQRRSRAVADPVHCPPGGVGATRRFTPTFADRP